MPINLALQMGNSLGLPGHPDVVLREEAANGYEMIAAEAARILEAMKNREGSEKWRMRMANRESMWDRSRVPTPPIGFSCQRQVGPTYLQEKEIKDAEAQGKEVHWIPPPPLPFEFQPMPRPLPVREYLPSFV
jgi:hypothetical protein